MEKTPERFSAEVTDDYIHLKTWGQLRLDDLELPVTKALELAKKHNIKKILDDISGIEKAPVNLHVQMKGAGILWKLRDFDKVAIVFKDEELSFLFFSMLQNLHLSGNFKGFNNEADAQKWIKES